MKRLFLAIVVLALVGLGAIAVMTWRLDPEALGAHLIERVNSQSGIRLEAEKFSLHPLRGLEMTDAVMSGQVESGRLEAKVALLRMQHQVLPLLWGELVIDEVLLVEPAFDLTTRPTKGSRRRQRETGKPRRRTKGKRGQPREQMAPAISQIGGAGSEKLRLSIGKLTIQNGALSVRSRESGEIGVQVTGLNLVTESIVLEPGASATAEAVSAAASFSTGRIVHGDLQALRADGRMQFADGIADLTDLTIQSLNADLVVAHLTLSLVQDPPIYTAQAAGGMDLNGVLELGSPRNGFGPVAIDLAAEGRGPELGDLVGHGVLILNAGAIPGIPSMVRIEEVVGQVLLTGRQYRRTEIDYTVSGNKILLEPFEIVGDGANVGGSGEIDLAGPVSVDLLVRLPRRSLETASLDQGDLDAASDEEGVTTIPFRVGGTISDPTIELTWDGVKVMAGDATRDWAEEALDEVKRRAAEWLSSQSDSRDDG